MPDENQDQNPLPEENSIPQSPQEPTKSASENTDISEPPTMPSEVPEAPRGDFGAESNIITNKATSTLIGLTKLKVKGTSKKRPSN